MPLWPHCLFATMAQPFMFSRTGLKWITRNHISRSATTCIALYRAITGALLFFSCSASKRSIALILLFSILTEDLALKYNKIDLFQNSNVLFSWVAPFADTNCGDSLSRPSNLSWTVLLYFFENHDTCFNFCCMLLFPYVPNHVLLRIHSHGFCNRHFFFFCRHRCQRLRCYTFDPWISTTRCN